MQSTKSPAASSLPGRPGHRAKLAPPVDPARLALSVSPAEDLGQEFRRFSQQVAEFSRGIRGRLAPMAGADPRSLARLNVHIARTMFGKWSLEILSALYAVQSIGFEDLRRSLPGITSSVLSYRLQRMEAHGLVDRMVQTTRPVRVLYRLTARGLTVAVLGEPVFLFLQYAEAIEQPKIAPQPKPR